ncbi:maleylpyruvate isomerase N-terminal domain-containing protein [Streptomyces albiflavescens]|uniref:maleylpyruvate isomerase N-terminal domain-containing protein n=1 Tax=Streptomyces albiflavescens TaxID=1623582 RepID=UPI0016688752|nr:maleylpyruvate isomerase N-terminal domain-containing protein [Streptomyces albiflavescens]
MTGTKPLLTRHAEALDLLGDRVRTVRDDQWDAPPTPCTGWTVCDLVDHLVSGQLWVPPTLREERVAANRRTRPPGRTRPARTPVATRARRAGPRRPPPAPRTPFQRRRTRRRGRHRGAPAPGRVPPLPGSVPRGPVRTAPSAHAA